MMLQEKEESTKPVGRMRIEKWDYTRALLIFLVVLGHMTDQYVDDSESMRGWFLFIYFFHMPCFFFMDGLFSKRTINEKRYSHIFSYLILYLFIKILLCLVQGMIQGEFSFNLLEEQGTAWYALTLFFCCLITTFLKQFSRKWVLIASVVFACIVGYDKEIEDFLTLSRTFAFYPFFFAGYCADPAKLAEKFSGAKVRICGLVVLAALALACFCFTDNIYFMRALITGRNSYDKLGIVYDMQSLVDYGGLLRLLWYAIAAAASLALISVIPGHLSGGKWIAGIGRRSLQIYALHRPILYILYEGLGLFTVSMSWTLDKLLILPVAAIAALLTLLLGLPVWEKPVRAAIYPHLLEKKQNP